LPTLNFDMKRKAIIAARNKKAQIGDINEEADSIAIPRVSDWDRSKPLQSKFLRLHKEIVHKLSMVDAAGKCT
jgi:hypothetical protein